MKNIVFCDLDGTLIQKHSYKVNEENVNVINKFTNHGNYFIIATGRFIDRVLPILKQINKKQKNVDYVINLVGSCIYDVKNQKNLYLNSIENNIFSLLKNVIIQNKLPALIYNMDSFNLHGAITLNIRPRSIFLKISGNVACQVGEKIGEINDVLKIVLPFISKKREIKLLNLFAPFKDMVKIIPQKHYIEIMQKNVSKGSAILWLLNYLNVNKNDFRTIGIGDSENDLDMFEVTNRKYVVSIKPNKSRLNKYEFPIINNNDHFAVGKILNAILDEQKKE